MKGQVVTISGIVVLAIGIGMLAAAVIFTVVACLQRRKKKEKLEAYLKEWY